MKASGRMRNSTPPMAATRKPRPAGLPLRPSERIEGPEALGNRQIDAHHDDRDEGEGGGHRDVAGGALQAVDGHADERPGAADLLRDDVVAEGQREGEDRAGGDAGNG